MPWIATKLKSHILDDPKISYEMMNSILMDKYGCTTPQKQLYRARKHIVDIVEGEHKHMYALLPKYGMNVLQHNPGCRFKMVPEAVDECLHAPPPKRQPDRPPKKRKRAAVSLL
ncbi:hypothetical protein ACFE04_004130 [Oxalis oulophora]